MQVRELTRDQVAEIYRCQMQEDFDPAEIKPLSLILGLMDAGRYPCFGFYDGEVLAAYAMFCCGPEEDGRKGYLLLDYYAVNKMLRGHGYGGRCIQLMRERLLGQGYQGILGEVEQVLETNCAPGSVDDLRRRRIAFYERCGLRVTGVRCLLFGVAFVIMALDFAGAICDADVMKRLEEIYHVMHPPKACRENIKLSTAEKPAGI